MVRPTAVTVTVGVLALVALVACTRLPSEPTGGPGAVVYSSLGCASCHGADLAGTNAAPSLAGLSAHWTTEELVAYLQDPVTVQQQRPRLQYRLEQYPLQMPGYASHPRADLEALATFLLAG